MEQLASQKNHRAQIVLKLLDNPENFLSSVQVGITLIGIISGAYGGVTLTDDLEQFLMPFEWMNGYQHSIALMTVIGSITYFSIVVGELVPKTIAMNNAESIALFCVPVIKYFTLLTFPFVKLLSFTTTLFLKAFGIKENAGENLSEEELRFLLKTARKQGILEKEETDVHQNLFSFTDQTAKSLMTHSSAVEWVNLNSPKEMIYQKLKESVHSKFIVGNQSIDRIEGTITIRDFLANFKRDDFSLREIILPPIIIIQSTPAFKILNIFKSKKQYMAIVVDEFGSTLGIVTLHDLVEAIVGDLPDEDEKDELAIVKRSETSFLIDGKTLIYELNQYFQKEIIEDNIDSYTTISGFMLNRLMAFPKTGAKVRHKAYEFEIIDMDGVRIDKILMTLISEGFTEEGE